MNVFIEFDKSYNIYNKLSSIINNNVHNNREIVNGVFIKYKNTKWIVGPMINLDGNYINNKIKVEILLNNYYFNYEIKNIKSSFEKNINIETIDNNTILFDTHLNLFFIKFEKNINVNFHDIDKYNNKLFNYESNIINIKWLEVANNEITNCSLQTNIIDYGWDNNFCCLPPIPYIACNISNKKPLSGSIVYNHDYDSNTNTDTKTDNDFSNDSNFIGIVSYINDYIIVTPLSSIIRSLNYLYGDNILLINIETEQIKLNINNRLENGLLIKNNYYINYYNKIKKNKEISSQILNKYKTYSLLSKGSIIRSIDNMIVDDTGYLKRGNYLIPYNSYIWLFGNEYINIELYKISKNRLKSNFSNFSNIILNKVDYINIIYEFENINIGINLHEIKYIKYNRKYIFELNEKFIEIFKDLILHNEKIKNYITNNKFNVNNKKILVGIDLLDIYKFKIVYKNIIIDDIKRSMLNKETKKDRRNELRQYINYLLK